MNYTKKMQKAVLAVQIISRSDTPTCSRSIAVKLNIPKRYLEATLQKLRAQKIIVSDRGPSGGYLLGKDPSAIRVADIIQCAEYDHKTKEISVRAPDSGVRLLFKQNRERLIRSLNGLTIQNMDHL